MKPSPRNQGGGEKRDSSGAAATGPANPLGSDAVDEERTTRRRGDPDSLPDLAIERIDTEGVMKEGFTGQER